MQRIILIGSGGSGKSTLARQLGEVLNLPGRTSPCVQNVNNLTLAAAEVVVRLSAHYSYGFIQVQHAD